MKQGNRKHAAWVVGAASVAILLVGSMALGSNMGFKFNMPLPTGSPNPAPAGSNVMAVPFMNPYGTLKGVCTQLGLTGTGQVFQFDASGVGVVNGPQVCGNPEGGFTLDGTLGVFITDTAGSGSAVVVGSHNTGISVSLFAPSGPLPSGSNWVSMVYHTTAVLASDICAEIDAIGGAGTALQVAEFDASGVGVFIGPHTCGGGGDFAVTIGRALFIPVTSDVSWLPNHF